MATPMVSPPPVGDMAEFTLDELALVATEAHAEMQSHLIDGLASAILFGRACHEAHGKFTKRAEWAEWCRRELGLERTYVGQYERLAVYSEVLPAEALAPRMTAAGMMQSSINHALSYLRGLPPIRTRNPVKVTPELRKDMKRLRDGGMSPANIADMLGLSQSIVRMALDPEARRSSLRRSRERSREYRQFSRQRKKEEQRKEAVVLAKATGGDIGEAHAKVRRLEKTLNDAYAQTRQLEQAFGSGGFAVAARGARRQIDVALAALYKVEDALVKAMKVGV